MTTDSDGNIYVVGHFDGCYVTFGSYTLNNVVTCSSNADIFLVKYDPDGNVIWAKSAGGEYGDGANSIALDASGNIYVVGYYSYSSISFGTITLPSTTGTNMFLVKYDNNGNAIWAKNAGSNNCTAFSVKVGTFGNIYVSGSYSTSTISFGSITLTNNNTYSTYDYFLTKYNSNGNVIWAKSAGGDRDEFPYSLTLDNFDNIYVTGKYNSLSFIIGNDTLIRSGGNYLDNDIFLAKYDTDGNVIWAKSAGGYGDDVVNKIEIDNYGNVFLSGSFKSPTLDFGSTLLTNAFTQYTDMFFVKYDANGNAIWAIGAGGAYDDWASSVAIDNSGNVYITGSYYGPPITIGSYTLINGPLFVLKYDNDGNILWAKTPDSQGGYGHVNTIDVSGNLYVGGTFGTDSVTFGTTTLMSSASVYDFLIAKLANFTVNITQTNLSCYGEHDGTATVSLFGGNPPFTYVWNTVPPQTTQTVTGLAAGSYSVTVTDSNGFHSTASVIITQPNEILFYTQQTICLGDSYVFNGQNYTTSGNYSDTLTAVNGCDSIIQLSLTVDPLDTTQLSNSICQGSSYDFYGTLLNTAGTYYHKLISTYGCDSVISIDLILNPVYSTNNPQTICSGNSYVINGHTYTSSGNYIDTLQTFSGCDSIVTTNLTVNPTFSVNNPQTICNGESYIFNGHTYTTTGNFNDTLLTVHGCDSIIITQLTVNPAFLINNPQTICSGDSVLFNGNTYSVTGNYYDSLTTILGCDSILELSLFVAPLDSTDKSQAICQGSNYNFYGTLLTTEGIYYNTLVSTFGCDSVIILNLNVNPPPVADAGFDTTVFLGNSTQLYASGGLSYQWTPSDYLDDPGISNPISTPQNDITYIVIVTDINGCSMTDTINVFVEESNLWVPNVFNPNNPDPLNQKFYVRGKGIKQLEFFVYDRWGEKVFETHDINQGWDGTYKGKQLSTAVFMYYVKAIYYSGEKEEKKGDVTLIR